VTPAERELLGTIAADHGATLSDVVRWLAVRAAREVVAER
jgi:hypothetical protein